MKRKGNVDQQTTVNDNMGRVKICIWGKSFTSRFFEFRAGYGIVLFAHFTITHTNGSIICMLSQIIYTCMYF